VGRDRRHHDRAAHLLPPQGLALIRVYRIPFSTNVERVALAAGHKGIELEWFDVDPGDRSPVVAVSGQPLVPVLVDADLVLYDSPAIVEHLELQHPQPPLYPSEPARRAEVEIFVDWFNRVWKRPPNAMEDELEGPSPDEAAVDALSREMRASLDRFEALLDGRDYLFGEFGVADVIAFPFLKFAVLGLPAGDDELFHRILVEHQELGDGYPRLKAWVARVDAHPRS
jgi:glutathione S-transferase